MLYSHGRWLGIFNMHYHINMIIHVMAFDKPPAALTELVDNMVEFHLSETNVSCMVLTWIDRLTDGDANHYAIFLSQKVLRSSRKSNNSCDY